MTQQHLQRQPMATAPLPRLQQAAAAPAVKQTCSGYVPRSNSRTQTSIQSFSYRWAKKRAESLRGMLLVCAIGRVPAPHTTFSKGPLHRQCSLSCTRCGWEAHACFQNPRSHCRLRMVTYLMLPTPPFPHFHGPHPCEQLCYRPPHSCAHHSTWPLIPCVHTAPHLPRLPHLLPTPVGPTLRRALAGKCAPPSLEPPHVPDGVYSHAGGQDPDGTGGGQQQR